MSTRMIYYIPPDGQPGSATAWVNNLPGADQSNIPGIPYGIVITRVIQFQIVPFDRRFIVFVLVETDRQVAIG